MKILAIHNHYYLRGGDSRCFLKTNKLLERKGHEVISFSISSKKNISSEHSQYFLSDLEEEKPWIKYPKRVERTFYSFEARRALEKILHDYAPEIAHLHNIYGGISPSILPILKKKNIFVVQTLHDYKLFCPVFAFYSKGETCERCKLYKYYNCLLNSCSPYSNSFFKSAIHMLTMYFHKFILNYEKRIDHFITPSNFMRLKAIEYGIKEEKLTHIANFIDLEKYEPCYEFDNYIIYFGRLSHEKGVDLLIEAMRDISGVDLLIVGEGPEYEQYFRLSEELKAKNIKFLGYRSGDELKNLIKRGMFTIMPSRWYENGPFVIYESFALGTPLLGANIGGIPEFIDDGENGWLFEPNDVDDLRHKILYAIKNKDRIKLMGRNARKAVEERYSAEGYYKKLMKIYKRIT